MKLNIIYIFVMMYDKRIYLLYFLLSFIDSFGIMRSRNIGSIDIVRYIILEYIVVGTGLVNRGNSLIEFTFGIVKIMVINSNIKNNKKDIILLLQRV